jgi:hypothetical protein
LKLGCSLPGQDRLQHSAPCPGKHLPFEDGPIPERTVCIAVKRRADLRQRISILGVRTQAEGQQRPEQPFQGLPIRTCCFSELAGRLRPVAQELREAKSGCDVNDCGDAMGLDEIEQLEGRRSRNHAQLLHGLALLRIPDVDDL